MLRAHLQLKWGMGEGWDKAVQDKPLFLIEWPHYPIRTLLVERQIHGCLEVPSCLPLTSIHARALKTNRGVYSTSFWWCLELDRFRIVASRQRPKCALAFNLMNRIEMLNNLLIQTSNLSSLRNNADFLFFRFLVFWHLAPRPHSGKVHRGFVFASSTFQESVKFCTSALCDITRDKWQPTLAATNMWKRHPQSISSNGKL